MRILLLFISIFFVPCIGQSQFKEQLPPADLGVKMDYPEIKNVKSLYQNNAKADVNSAFQLSGRDAAENYVAREALHDVKRIDGQVRSIAGLPKGHDRNSRTAFEYFFDYYQDVLEVSASDVEIVESKTDRKDKQHIRLQQNYKGIPIYGSEASLHGTTAGYDFYLGHFRKIKDIDTNPTLSEVDVERMLISKYGEQQVEREMPVGLKEILNANTELNLVIYVDEKENSFLAYKTLFYPDGIHRKEALVDAHDGRIIKEFDSFCKFHNHKEAASEMPPPDFGSGQDLFGQTQNFNTWREGSTYYLLDASRSMFNSSASNMPNDPVGAIWTLAGNGQDPQNSNFGVSQITSSSTTWNSRTAVSAHLNGSKSYEYYANTFGRNSINGQGGTIVSILNAGAGNAFWNGQAIFYGNADGSFEDLARGLDVAGHEMSHGVIQNTANLEYYGESGALNESFADIFGAMIDRDDWLIGEDVVKSSSFPSGALRNMMDPHNGGSGTQDLNRGWQPNRYSERFTGQEDNNGVHINSGISNRAYYLFASNGSVGKAKAERVYFKVLDNYLTRSSDFADLRAALEQVVGTDFGTNSAEWTALQNALNVTQFPGGGGVIEEPELETNPGDDFMLLTTDTQEGIYLADATTSDFQLLTNDNLISKPSVTDDGSIAVFVDGNKNLRFMTDFPGANTVQNLETYPEPIWRNVIISKDASLIAALTDSVNNAVYVFNLDWQNNGQPSSRRYELYNPTFTDGVTTGDVLYADAMEFSADGEFIIYDALNRIQNNSGQDIDYWDIGFIDIWDRSNAVYRDGRIQKLFNQLPDDVSIGNPTFSKNSPNVIAFDLLENQDWFILGMNIETNEYSTITSNNKIGYPTYSTDDTQIAFDHDDSDGAAIYKMAVDDTKIMGVGSFTPFLISGAHWAVWYGNGERVLVGAEDLEEELSAFNMFPNPAADVLEVVLDSPEKIDRIQIEIVNALGQSILIKYVDDVEHMHEVLDIQSLDSGIYFLNLSTEHKRLSRSFVKTH